MRRSTNLVFLERNYIRGFDAGDEGAGGLDNTTLALADPDFGAACLSRKESIDTAASDRHFAA